MCVLMLCCLVGQIYGYHYYDCNSITIIIISSIIIISIIIMFYH